MVSNHPHNPKGKTLTKQIESVAILGAGAMGAIYASKFQDASDFTLHLVARGDRCQQLRQHGLVINGKTYHFSVLDPETATNPVFELRWGVFGMKGRRSKILFSERNGYWAIDP